jgi:hypothetical protein
MIEPALDDRSRCEISKAEPQIGRMETGIEQVRTRGPAPSADHLL